MNILQFLYSAGPIFLTFFMIGYSYDLIAQEKMEVEGIVHSKNGGFKFPDDTLQETAAAKLTGIEVSDKRGKVTARFSGVTNVNPSTNFNVLEISFSARRSIGPTTVSELQITHNLEQDWPDFFDWFTTNIGGHTINVQYFDENDVHYMTHTFTGCLMESIEHLLNPFSPTSFGHLVKMSHSYNEIAIFDIVGNNCKCWDLQTNLATNCGCP